MGSAWDEAPQQCRASSRIPRRSCLRYRCRRGLEARVAQRGEGGCAGTAALELVTDGVAVDVLPARADELVSICD